MSILDELTEADLEPVSEIELVQHYRSTAPPEFDNPAEARRHRKERLAAALRLFGRFGFDEGVAGHITARDPEFPDYFWVNPFGVPFAQASVSKLLLVNHEGKVVRGEYLVNEAAFVIHSTVHQARPDVVGAAHAHSIYGKALSSTGQQLEPLTQDACVFYDDHAIFEDYTGLVNDLEEGQRIARTLGSNKAIILRNHGILTVGATVDSAAYWFITMERSAQAQLAAKASGEVHQISPENAKLTHEQSGHEYAGWIQFQPLFELISREEPDLFD